MTLDDTDTASTTKKKPKTKILRVLPLPDCPRCGSHHTRRSSHNPGFLSLLFARAIRCETCFLRFRLWNFFRISW